jgi:hypothetical protein
MVYVRGNHEVIAADGEANYREFVGSEDWSFDFAGCRFIGLDNARRVFEQQTLDFLSQSLQSRQGLRHTFVMFHVPPAVGRWAVHAMRTDEKGGRGSEAIQLIEKSDVDAVFLGHIHLFDEMRIGSIPYFISGGAGSPLYTKYKFGRPEYGLLLVHVSSKTVSYTWVPLDGASDWSS